MSHSYFVIGAGSIGQRHHANLTALGASSQLVGWRGLDMRDFETRLIKAGQAAMVIATATDQRIELAELAGRLGVPVYIEKPLAFRTADVDQIYVALETVADRSVVGLMMRYHPAFRSLVDEEGHYYGFHLEIGHDVRQWRKNWRFADSYAAREEGGGVLLDLCHELDMAHCLFPDVTPNSIDCIGHTDFPGVDFATQVSLTAEGGPIGTVAMDYLSPKSLRRIALRGRDQVVDLDLGTLVETRSASDEDTTRSWTFERNDMFLDLMRDFIALAEGGQTSDNPLMPRLDKVRASCELIASAWQSRTFHGAISGGF